MNESTLAVPPLTLPVEPEYKNRSGGLTVFGVLTILLGLGSGGMVLLMLLGFFINARNPNMPASNLAALLPSMLMYVGLALALVWLGIGSIKARRWARALLLIFAWSWLVMGVIMVAAILIFLPMLLAEAQRNAPAGQSGLPASAVTSVMVIATMMLGFIFILLPAVWVYFYGSRHVKATCEARDPVRRWTDACPLPVLAMSLWLWFSVPILLLMPFTAHGVTPFFGIFLQGVLGGAFYVLIAAIWGWAGWRLYRLDVRAWWVILISLLVIAASSAITYAQHDLVEMYQLMGYPEAQIEQIQKTGMLTGNRMAWIAGCSMLPFLGYLFVVKRYLGKRGPAETFNI